MTVSAYLTGYINSLDSKRFLKSDKKVALWCFRKSMAKNIIYVKVPVFDVGSILESWYAEFALFWDT